MKRLEGNVSSLRVQKKPDSVIVYDKQALPAAWKDVLLTMPAFVWEALLGRLPGCCPEMGLALFARFLPGVQRPDVH